MHSISTFDIIYLTANILALLAAYMLFFKFQTYNKFSNRLLSLFLFENVCCNFSYLLIASGWIESVPYLYRIAAPITYLGSPLAFLYVRSLLNQNTRFKKKDTVHLIPFLLFFVNYIPFYLMGLEEKQELVSAVVNNISLNYTHQDGLLPEWVNIACRSLQSVLYLVLQWRLIFLFHKKITTSNSAPQVKPLKKWVILFTAILSFYFLSLIVLYLIIASIENTHKDVLLNIQVAAISVLISASYLYFAIYILTNSSHLFGTSQLSIFKSFKKKTNNNLSEQKAQLIIESLEHHFKNDKPYLDPKLTINMVSLTIKTTPKTLSLIINTQLTLRFNDYLNKYRIHDILKEIDSGRLTTTTIETLSKEGGFWSKSAFNIAFKKQTGMTPREYSKKQKERL